MDCKSMIMVVEYYDFEILMYLNEKLFEWF